MSLKTLHFPSAGVMTKYLSNHDSLALDYYKKHVRLESVINMADYDALLAKLWMLSEEERLDFKQPFIFGKENKKEMYGLIQDILAMANTEGGGYIIIGRGDNCGPGIDCSEDVIKSFDPTKVHTKTKKYGKPEPQFFIYHATSPENTRALIIHIKEFEEYLVICSENAHDAQNKLLLRESAIYIRSRTNDAESRQIMSEQDMRSLINRSIAKSKESLMEVVGRLGDYLKGSRASSFPNEDAAIWKKKINASLLEFDTYFPVKQHMLQIVAYPESYDSHRLENSSILFDRLVKSVSICNGWSFPYPDFELRKKVMPSGNNDIIHTFSREFMEGSQFSGVLFGVSGLCIYREELTKFYDNATPGKPLLVYSLLITLYRAFDFFGRFYKSIQANECLHIEVLITDVHGRYPAVKVCLLKHLELFYEAEALPCAKITCKFGAERGDFSHHTKQVYTRFLRQLTTEMGIGLSDNQLEEEVIKIVHAEK